MPNPVLTEAIDLLAARQDLTASGTVVDRQLGQALSRSAYRSLQASQTRYRPV